MTIALPFEVRNRAELVDALSTAAQVEHAVLLEYLYAAFSCRHTTDPSLSPRAQAVSWQAARELYLIAHDEMDHLGVVQQLLAALGAPPVPDGRPFPIRDGSLPFACELTRLDLDTIDRFVATEAPPVSVAGFDEIRPPDQIRFDALGDLYRAIIAGIERLGDDAFLGAPVTTQNPSPLTFQPSGPTDLRYRVANAQDAVASLRRVVLQGEGAGAADAPASHFRRFEAIRAQMDGLGAEAASISWPCVANPSVRTSDEPSTVTVFTNPSTIALGDVANRAYRSLWELLGLTYLHDWSARDPDDAKRLRMGQRFQAMQGARHVMATVIRPLGELLARRPAFADDPTGPTAGMGFEQYGEFRVPVQPDARDAAIEGSLSELSRDLVTVAGSLDPPDPAASTRLLAMADTVAILRDRYLGKLDPPPGLVFEPPGTRTWLTVDFSGWYQVRLATGGDPYDDPRGLSGWQFALPGEPDLDRVIRFQPAGTFLREHLDPDIDIGVKVDAAVLDGDAVPGLVGATVDLLDSPVFDGRNGVIAGDGAEPIIPLHLSIVGADWELARQAADQYVVPYLDQVALDGGDPDIAKALRAKYELPAGATATQALVTAARARLKDAADAAEQAGDLVAATTLRMRRSQVSLFSVPWSVGWRLRLVGADPVVQVPAGIGPLASADTWWLELISTGFVPDAGCALVRGVLHVPVGPGADEPPPWMLVAPAPGPAVATMPLDELGSRPGRGTFDEMTTDG